MKLHWMPLDIAAYRADTAHLGALEHGIYLLLIMHYWQTGGLPDDEKQLARIACATPAEFRGARAVIETFFKPGWKHERVERELAKAREIRSKRRGAAEARHALQPRPEVAPAAHGDANAGAHAVHVQTHLPSHLPSPTHSAPLSSNESRMIQVGEGKRDACSPPRHGAISKVHGRVYVEKHSSEWTAYAEDYRKARGTEPIANSHGGRWFRTLGEGA